MRRSVRVAAVTCAAAMALVGCSSGDGSQTAAGAQQVTVHATDQFRFTPSTIHARVGTLRIVLADDGSYPHNISFPGLHTTSRTVSGDPGQGTTTFTVTLSHPGTYEFACAFHSSAGMKGRVIVAGR